MHGCQWRYSFLRQSALCIYSVCSVYKGLKRPICPSAGRLWPLLLCIILVTATTPPLAREQKVPLQRRSRVLPSPILRKLPLPSERRAYELVVTRFDEEIHWIQHVPTFWFVTVLNKGKPDLAAVRDDLEIFHCPQTNENGREGELMAAYIHRRWNTLAEYTAFSQGYPFEHNPEYIFLLQQPNLLKPVQTMSYIYKPDVTNAEAIAMHKKHPLYRSETFSLRTLDSVYFWDDYIWLVAQWLAENFTVPLGTNLVNHYLGTVGLPLWVPKEQEVGTFAYGAMLGLHKSKIQQHSQDVYARISTSVINFRWTGVLLERTWLMIFGGPEYRDS